MLLAIQALILFLTLCQVGLIAMCVPLSNQSSLCNMLIHDRYRRECSEKLMNILFLSVAITIIVTILTIIVKLSSFPLLAIGGTVQALMSIALLFTPSPLSRTWYTVLLVLLVLSSLIFTISFGIALYN
jgi:hypothetical protein